MWMHEHTPRSTSSLLDLVDKPIPDKTTDARRLTILLVNSFFSSSLSTDKYSLNQPMRILVYINSLYI